MPGVTNYVPYTPSPNTAVVNDQNPGAGFYLIAAQTQENVPRSDVPTLTSILRPVGLQEVSYILQYFTMAAISAAIDLEYCDNSPALQLQYFGAYVDNAFMVAGSVGISPVSGDRGILAVRWTQRTVALAQLVDCNA